MPAAGLLLAATAMIAALFGYGAIAAALVAFAQTILLFGGSGRAPRRRRRSVMKGWI